MRLGNEAGPLLQRRSFCRLTIRPWHCTDDADYNRRMKDWRQGRCPLCAHDEVVESMAAEFIGIAETAMSVTYEVSEVVLGRDPAQGRGALAMYVCRKCGYVQWFAQNPAKIPIDKLCRTRLIKAPKTPDPFR